MLERPGTQGEWRARMGRRRAPHSAQDSATSGARSLVQTLPPGRARTFRSIVLEVTELPGRTNGIDLTASLRAAPPFPTAFCVAQRHTKAVPVEGCRSWTGEPVWDRRRLGEVDGADQREPCGRSKGLELALSRGMSVRGALGV
jgi:hypothetical protein